MSMDRYELVKKINDLVLEAACDEEDTKLSNVYEALTGREICACLAGEFHHGGTDMSMERHELVKKINDWVLEAACRGEDTKLANVYGELTNESLSSHRGEFHHIDEDGGWAN